MSKTPIRKNGDGWIRLQYREMNTHQWITLHIFKGYELKYVFYRFHLLNKSCFHCFFKCYEIITIDDCSTSTYSRYTTT